MVEKIIGILGGMGPEATADIYHRIILATPAQSDQEHIKTIIYSNPKIPDRTQGILGNAPSPVPLIVETAKILENAGADFLIMPCNTAHYFIDKIQSEINVPILNMIKLAADSILRNHSGVNTVGLLATDGTIKTRLYQNLFEAANLRVLTPDSENQEKTMKGIYSHIKSGGLAKGRELLLQTAEHLIDSGAEILVCGCTEISLVIKNGDFIIPVVDPMQVIAEYAVEVALGEKT